jgi:very-short-patch-repair endonuclease
LGAPLVAPSWLTGRVAHCEIRPPSGTRCLDIAFPERRIATEIDGRRVDRADSGRLNDDRVRRNELVALDWQVIRVTRTMLA